MKDRKVKNMVKILLLLLLIILLLFLIIQFIQCKIAVKKGYERLEAYDAITATLSYGTMSYVDKGQGETILSILENKNIFI